MIILFMLGIGSFTVAFLIGRHISQKAYDEGWRAGYNVGEHNARVEVFNRLYGVTKGGDE